ncbi:antitoxin Xre/MbcA/ParS toxin-binding domain-containing protein [Sphingomonas astaxanthinifaciens]|nr:antitoxin Xre/MbcA/ParS toxin-binding domain-containing protein [Sphingomonas astaxanthinifaciens]
MTRQTLFDAISDRNFGRFLSILDAGAKRSTARAARHTTVQKMAAEVLGGNEEANNWIQEPAIALNQQRPVDLLNSDEGAKLVLELLEVIEHGVYT